MPLTYISYLTDASVSKAIGFPLIGRQHFINGWNLWGPRESNAQAARCTGGGLRLFDDDKWGWGLALRNLLCRRFDYHFIAIFHYGPFPIWS